MLHSSIWVGLLILCGTILAEDVVPHDELYQYISHATDQTSRTGRLFGFSVLEEIRKTFCHSFCTSADTMPYLLNLFCAAKCPDLYLPHSTTTAGTTSTTPSAAQTTANPTIVPSTTLSPSPTTLAPSPTSPSGSGQSPGGSSSSTPSTNPTSTSTQTTTSSSSTTQSPSSPSAPASPPP